MPAEKRLAFDKPMLIHALPSALAALPISHMIRRSSVGLRPSPLNPSMLINSILNLSDLHLHVKQTSIFLKGWWDTKRLEFVEHTL